MAQSCHEWQMLKCLLRDYGLECVGAHSDSLRRGEQSATLRFWHKAMFEHSRHVADHFDAELPGLAGACDRVFLENVLRLVGARELGGTLFDVQRQSDEDSIAAKLRVSQSLLQRCISVERRAVFEKGEGRPHRSFGHPVCVPEALSGRRVPQSCLVKLRELAAMKNQSAKSIAARLQTVQRRYGEVQEADCCTPDMQRSAAMLRKRILTLKDEESAVAQSFAAEVQQLLAAYGQDTPADRVIAAYGLGEDGAFAPSAAPLASPSGDAVAAKRRRDRFGQRRDA